MSQLQWIYKDVGNVEYYINLYHGDKSGHLLIYINTDIIIIDFEVKKEKNYGFYIDDKFFELQLSGIQDHFSYKLISGPDVLQTSELVKKQKNRLYKFHTMIFVLGVILILIIIYLLFVRI